MMDRALALRPTLGLDQRNQFDMYRDPPAGWSARANWPIHCVENGSKVLCLAYNPWDESTRRQSPCKDRFATPPPMALSGYQGENLQPKGCSRRLMESVKGVVCTAKECQAVQGYGEHCFRQVHNTLVLSAHAEPQQPIRPDFAISGSGFKGPSSVNMLWPSTGTWNGDHQFTGSSGWKMNNQSTWKDDPDIAGKLINFTSRLLVLH